ncbi:MAG TPA: class IV adenylate cyclase [Verrucomicrobiae bacterium]|nr:class IV adenylate cyclase [Verrucomicrobiae bacterium]
MRSSVILTEVRGGGKPRREARKEMAQETEVKLRISDAKAFKRALKRLEARAVGRGSGRVREWNVIFDTPDGGLAKHGQLLRIRTETAEAKSKKGHRGPAKRIMLTFKRPLVQATARSGGSQANHHHKVREEIELEVADASALAKIFEGLGMRGWFQYEKYRTTFCLPTSESWAKGLLIELDETPIGTFAELEGPSAAIDRAAQELGHSRHDYILKSYLALYVEECRRLGQEPRDMVFAAKK